MEGARRVRRRVLADEAGPECVPQEVPGPDLGPRRVDRLLVRVHRDRQRPVLELVDQVGDVRRRELELEGRRACDRAVRIDRAEVGRDGRRVGQDPERVARLDLREGGRGSEAATVQVLELDGELDLGEASAEVRLSHQVHLARGEFARVVEEAVAAPAARVGLASRGSLAIARGAPEQSDH